MNVDVNELINQRKAKKSNSGEKNILIEDDAKNEWVATHFTKAPDILLKIICDEILNKVSLSQPPWVLTALISWHDLSEVKIEIVGRSKYSYSHLHKTVQVKTDTEEPFTFFEEIADGLFWREKLKNLPDDLHLEFTKKEGSYHQLAKLLDSEDLKIEELPTFEDHELFLEAFFNEEKLKELILNEVRKKLYETEDPKEADKKLAEVGHPPQKRIKIVLSQVMIKIQHPPLV